MTNPLIDRYLDLLAKTLLDDIYGSQVSVEQHWDAPRAGQPASDGEIEQGLYWPERAHTMIGRRRLMNLREVVETTLRDGVPGDYIETGAWRGGASIFIRGILAAHGVTDRTVWVADSFAGLPPPDPRYPADEGDQHSEISYLAVSRETVEDNFRSYKLLDDQVAFLEGFFEETLPDAPIEQLAVLRLDGDMYSSTMQALDSLYGKVTPGGFVVVDDYALPGCKQAIDDFRNTHGITTPMTEIDWSGTYWRLPS